MKLETKIQITSSKVMAFLILILGTIFAFIFHDASVIITAMSVSSATILGKTVVEGFRPQHKEEEMKTL